MSNVIITNEELEQIVDYLESCKCMFLNEWGKDDIELNKLIHSLSIALDRNIEYVE